MMTCINPNHPEYKNLQEKSGLSNRDLELECMSFLDKHDRFPHLDEILDANSEDYLRDKLKINLHNAVNIEDTLELTGRDSLELVVIDLNDEHRDLLVEITPIVNKAIVDITHRPTTNNFNLHDVEVDENPDNCLVFNKALVKLATLNGINFKVFTEEELFNYPIYAQSAKAFVYNGDIHINLDRASVDDPLHEMMHIFVGSVRFTDPKLYLELIQSVSELPNYELMASQYSNRTVDDINEEIFVSEVSKYVTGLDSFIGKLLPNLQYELGYNIKRVLDTILMGLVSVKTLSDYNLYNMSLKQVAKEVRSTIMANSFKGFINVEDSSLHRKLNNIKSDLLKSRTLEEVCE